MQLPLFRLPIAFTAMLAALIPLHAQSASASPAPADDHALLTQLAAEVAADHAQIAADHTTIAGLKAQLAAQAQPAASSTTYGPFTVTGKDVYLTGYNLHIQSGSGSTTGAVNGYGNLIIGYDESASGVKHTGSHNLVVGPDNSYSSYGGIVGGIYNTITEPYCSVVGGRRNTASGSTDTIAGGYGVTTSGSYTAAVGPMSSAQTTTQGNDGKNHSGYLVTFTGANVQIVNGLGATDGEPNNQEDVTNYVTNGLGNLIIGYSETQASLGQGATDTRTGSHNLILGDYNEYSGFGGMVGGSFDTLAAAYSGVVSGSFNYVDSADSAILGGEGNTVDTNYYATVSGGSGNEASGKYSSVSGGGDNIASGAYACVTGGDSNQASGSGSSVSGGASNQAQGGESSITAGYGNIASGQRSAVTGGVSNTVSQYCTTVSGGNNISDGNQSGWAAGTYSSP